MNKTLFKVAGVVAVSSWWAACTADDPLTPAVPSPGEITDAGLSSRVDELANRVRDRPRDLTARMQLAALYDANGIPGLAVRTYEQVLEIDPRHKRAWYHLGRQRARLGDSDGALEAYGHALLAVPGYAPTHWRRGRLLLSLGRVDEAGAAFDRATALDPDDPDGPIGAARVALERGEAAAAAARLEEVVRRWPMYGRAVRLLGRAWQEAGEPEKAREVLSGTIPETKYLVDPWARKVQTMKVSLASDRSAAVAERGDDDTNTKVDTLERLAAERPDDVNLLEQLVLKLERSGRGDHAMELLETRCLLRPDHHRVELLLAGAFERRGDIPSALRHALLAVEKQPEFAPSRLELGRLWLESGDPDGALEELLHAKRLGASGARLEEALVRARTAAEGGN